MANLKGVKMTAEQQAFLMEYRRLEELEREKGIKFFQCVGDPPHTQGFVNNVHSVREDIKTDTANKMRHKDCTRFETHIDKDKVVVDITTGGDITAKPKWDVFENNHFAMRRRLVAIFLRASNKMISRIRAAKRLKQIQNWINERGIRTREEMKNEVALDNKKAQNTRVVDDSSAENDIRNVKFEFCFNAKTIKNALLKLPLEYETNISSFLEKVDANPPTNFDDLVPFKTLE